MHFQFLLSSPHGDIEPSPEEMEQSFLVSPGEQHPFLTLADYFGVLQEFVLADDGYILREGLQKKGLQADIDLSDIADVVIRSEKHGAFYHVASVEIFGLGENIKFACTTALSESARASLQEEYGILKELSSISQEYIPELYCRNNVTWQTESGTEKFFMVLGEWLHGYHEWHTSVDPESGERKIQLWDYESGFRFLPGCESYELLYKAAYILTLYYDQASFCQIYPWHHGAGDFVVAAAADRISVKLITARQYEPLVYFEGEEEADPLVAGIHFLLNLVLRVRLDRLDGVVDPVWLEEYAVHAAVTGFFAGLAASRAKNRLIIGPETEFLEIMQSFDAREIYDMYESMLAIYTEEDQDDFLLIQEKIADHAALVHTTLQGFSLEKT